MNWVKIAEIASESTFFDRLRGGIAPTACFRGAGGKTWKD
jgi:hypothetical protein